MGIFDDDKKKKDDEFFPSPPEVDGYKPYGTPPVGTKIIFKNKLIGEMGPYDIINYSTNPLERLSLDRDGETVRDIWNNEVGKIKPNGEIEEPWWKWR